MVLSKWKTAAALATMLVFSGAAVAWADIYWECEQVVRGEGRRDKKKTIRNYYTPDRTRVDIGENVMIADFKTMTGYVLNTRDKMFLEMKMDAVGKIPEGLKEEIEARPTEETKEIAGYTCRKYRVTLMGREYEQWISKEVEGYRELKAINDRLTQVIRDNPLFQMGIVGRMHKLDGFPVRTVMELEGGLTKTITLTKVVRKPIRQKVFRVPKGYKPPY